MREKARHAVLGAWRAAVKLVCLRQFAGREHFD
jgi:hypothetical protein